MSARGVYGKLTDGGSIVSVCLAIGWRVPSIHMSDGIPVYQVVIHPLGTEFVLVDPRRSSAIRVAENTVRLLAYPSHWPAPGARTPERSLFTNMELVPWNGRMIPVFDTEPLRNV